MKTYFIIYWNLEDTLEYMRSKKKQTFSFLESKKKQTFSDKNFQMLIMSDQGVGGHPMGVYMICKWVFDIFEKKSTPLARCTLFYEDLKFWAGGSHFENFMFSRAGGVTIGPQHWKKYQKISLTVSITAIFLKFSEVTSLKSYTWFSPYFDLLFV